MSFASRHNKVTPRFTFQQENAPFIKLQELAERFPGVSILRGMFTNTGKYGEQPVFVIDGYNVNMPKHMLQTAKEIMESDEDVADINAGKVAIKPYSYQANGKTCYSVDFLDVE